MDMDKGVNEARLTLTGIVHSTTRPEEVVNNESVIHIKSFENSFILL